MTTVTDRNNQSQQQTETSRRTSLLGSALERVPFQLLPRVVYPPEKQEQTLQWQTAFAETLENGPHFTVYLILSGDRFRLLEAQIESLAVQSYRRFEVVVLMPEGDARVHERASALLAKLGLSGRIVASDPGLSLAVQLIGFAAAQQGDYLLALDERTILHPQALLILAKTIMRRRPDLLFSNEVVLSDDLQQAREYFRKSPLEDFSLLSTNLYGAGLICSAKFAARTLPALTLESRDVSVLAWSMACEARAGRRDIEFIQLGLFHLAETPPATDQRSGADAVTIVRNFARRRRLAIAEARPDADANGLRLALRPAPATGRVQVIIPFRNRAEVTIGCLRSLFNQSIREDLDVLLIDNGSSSAERRKIDEFIVATAVDGWVKVMDRPGYFNFAALNNSGSRRSVSPYLLFLNNDVELTSAETLAELRDWCALEDVAVTGGALYYPNGELQHGGINFSGVRPCNVSNAWQYSDLLREVNAVTFAMALVKRRVFDLVGGLDEFLCPNGFGDAVFCHEVKKRGYRVLYTPRATATHHESLSRGQLSEELELYEMTQCGIPISDLYADMSARHQPTRLNLIELMVHEEPLRESRQRSIPARATIARFTTRIANRVFRAGGV